MREEPLLERCYQGLKIDTFFHFAHRYPPNCTPLPPKLHTATPQTAHRYPPICHRSGLASWIISASPVGSASAAGIISTAGTSSVSGSGSRAGWDPVRVSEADRCFPLRFPPHLLHFPQRLWSLGSRPLNHCIPCLGYRLGYWVFDHFFRLLVLFPLRESSSTASRWAIRSVMLSVYVCHKIFTFNEAKPS